MLLSFQFTEAIYKTRLSSIESQPKKVVVVVGIVVAVVVVIFIGHKNLTYCCFHCFSFVVVVVVEL